MAMQLGTAGRPGMTAVAVKPSLEERTVPLLSSSMRAPGVV